MGHCPRESKGQKHCQNMIFLKFKKIEKKSNCGFFFSFLIHFDIMRIRPMLRIQSIEQLTKVKVKGTKRGKNKRELILTLF